MFESIRAPDRRGPLNLNPVGPSIHGLPIALLIFRNNTPLQISRPDEFI
jgi:hypothetical protein